MPLRPSPVVADASSFKVHTAADGRLWCAEDDKEPALVAETVEEFLESPSFRRCKRFRVVATSANATLIARLFVSARVPVELSTPRIGLNATELADPRVAILRARSQNNKLPVCLGGWHVMTPNDYIPYALADAIRQKKSKETLIKMLWRHPAAGAWSFTKLFDAAALAGVIAAIRDPRWFIDRRHPDRLSTVMQYMGMDQRTMQWAIGKSCKPVGPNDRAKLVLDSWYVSKNQPTRSEIQLPQYYLWHHLTNSRSECAELRSSQMFLKFVCQTWLAALVDRRKSEPLFEPTYFFHRPIDVEAYKKHMKSWSK